MFRRGGRIALLLALGLLAAAPAHAGVYSVYACHTPSGAPAPLDGWAPGRIAGNTRLVQATDECRGGVGAMALRFPAAERRLDGHLERRRHRDLGLPGARRHGDRRAQGRPHVLDDRRSRHRLGGQWRPPACR